VGEPHSGKTHLCHTFLEKQSHLEKSTVRFLNGHVCAANHPFDLNDTLFVLDDADKAPEPWLFHFFNHLKEKQARVVMTMSQPHHRWCRLPDLASRLTTLPIAILDLPDDALLLAMLKKNLIDAGVFVDDSVLTYLGHHIDRSYTMVHHWVTLLERLSAEQKRNITIAFIRKILNQNEVVCVDNAQ
jgi:chromosomal replication initiation ATPase DnaA